VDGAGGDTRTSPFRPEAFFAGRTEGWGVARGPTGRILRRCRLVTDGRVEDTYRAINFDETFHWEDGEIDLWRWAMTRGLDGRYVAAEARAGAGIHGRHEGSDYLLSFRRALRPDGGPRARFHTRFTPISPDVTLKIVRISLMGLPVGGLTAFHQRVS
jgi:hypothetical protein